MPRTLSYRKQDWPDGPWQQELDFKEWEDKATGLDCMIKRGPMGALCGYVGVTDSHPLFRHSYEPPDDYWSLNAVQVFWRAHVNKRKEYLLGDIRVHGGLTFADFWYDDKKVFYFGFDCSHAFDLCPMMLQFETMALSNDIYRDWTYTQAQVESLAKQLKAIK